MEFISSVACPFARRSLIPRIVLVTVAVLIVLIFCSRSFSVGYVGHVLLHSQFSIGKMVLKKRRARCPCYLR
jgi:hypothetical protein